MAENLKFNQRYGISDELQNKLKLVKQQKYTHNIAGKPKILAIEILKRFFTNPMVVIAFCVFLAIIITALVVSFSSPYPAVKPIDYYLPVDKKVSDFQSLPPIFAQWTETTDNNKITNLYRWSSEPYSKYLKEYANFKEIVPGQILYYNAYSYFEGQQLYSKIFKILDKDPNAIITAEQLAEFKNAIPKLHTFFGTNNAGTDIWTTVWKGTLESLWIALFVATVEIIIGVFVGAYLGFNAGKWLDTVMMRIIEIFTSPPSIIWLLLFVSIWGTNPWVLIAGLLFVGWTGPIGVTRLFIITVKDEEYILAAKSIGASEKRQIFFHALPAILGKIAMSYVRRIPSVILSIASLAFLGFFKDDSSANLGKFMLDNLEDSKNNVWLLIIPASILLCISISLQFIAVGLHDALDPKVIKLKR